MSRYTKIMALSALTTSALVSTASAIEYTLDFEGSDITETKCSWLYGAMSRFQKEKNLNEQQRDVFNLFFPSNSLEGVQEDGYKASVIPSNPVTYDDPTLFNVVFKNGKITQEESQKLLKKVKYPFNIIFSKCEGTLDLNQNFKDNVEQLRIQDCEFTIAPDCFKDIKKLAFFTNEFTLQGERLGIDLNKSKFEQGLEGNTIHKFCKLETIIKSENKGKSKDDSEKNEKELSSRIKELEEKVSLLQGALDEETKKLKDSFRNNKKENEKLENENMELKGKIKKLNENLKAKEQINQILSTQLKPTPEVTKEQLTAFLGLSCPQLNFANERRQYKARIEVLGKQLSEMQELNGIQKLAFQRELNEMKLKNEQQKVAIDRLEIRNAKLMFENGRIQREKGNKEKSEKKLGDSLSKLQKEYEKLKAENSELTREFLKRSDICKKAEATLQEYKELKEENEKLRGAKGRVKELEEVKKELKKELEIIVKWLNLHIGLMKDLLKNTTTRSVTRDYLATIRYFEKQKEVQQELFGNEKSNEGEVNKKSGTKKGKWKDLTEWEKLVGFHQLFLDQKEIEEEDIKTKDWVEDDGKDYFEDQTNKQVEQSNSKGQYSQGRGGRGCYRGRGKQGNFRGRNNDYRSKNQYSYNNQYNNWYNDMDQQEYDEYYKRENETRMMDNKPRGGRRRK